MAETGADRACRESPAARTYGPVAPKVADQVLIERLTSERDRYATMLLSAEQELAKRAVAEPDDLEWYREAFLTLVDSRSWRLTKPLRAAGRIARRMRGRRA
jgi:hypothetical protein